MAQTDAELEMIEALYRAASAPHGVVTTVSDTGQAIALAYRVRASLGDPSLAGLRFVRSPTQANELWIVRDDPGARITPQTSPTPTNEEA